MDLVAKGDEFDSFIFTSPHDFDKTVILWFCKQIQILSLRFSTQYQHNNFSVINRFSYIEINENREKKYLFF